MISALNILAVAAFVSRNQDFLYCFSISNFFWRKDPISCALHSLRIFIVFNIFFPVFAYPHFCVNTNHLEYPHLLDEIEYYFQINNNLIK